MTDRLTVHLDNRLVGHFIRQDADRIGFIYTDEWRADWARGRAFPISVSLPITRSGEILDGTAYAAGLLPDAARHRTLIADELGIADDPSDFAFLAKLGRDCAGALIIVPEDEDHRFAGPPGLKDLSTSELADHLRALPRRPLMVDEEEGITLSLAGVNDKAAVVLRKKSLALPLNGMPSTHIIKVDIPGLPDSIKTEHFCLQLAKSIGIRVPITRIHQVEDVSFMLMARYDRSRLSDDTPIQRIHQEDFCQALGISPGKKYQRHGGPGWAQCFDLVRDHVQDPEAPATLLKQAVFQFLCGNPDAHAKNYSLLHRGPSGQIQLAPLYDLNNAAAFRAIFKKVRPLMAMLIGRQSNPDEVTWEDWEQFSEEARISFRLVTETVITQAEEILENLDAVVGQCPDCTAIKIAAEDIRERCMRWRHGPNDPQDIMAMYPD